MPAQHLASHRMCISASVSVDTEGAAILTADDHNQRCGVKIGQRLELCKLP